MYGVLLLAQTAPVSEFTTWTQLGAFGVITSLFAWMVTKQGPAQTKAFMEALEKQQALNAAEQQKQRDQMKEMGEIWAKHSQGLKESFHELAVVLAELGADGLAGQSLRRDPAKVKPRGTEHG